jgi:hypothetical protein
MTPGPSERQAEGAALPPLPLIGRRERLDFPEWGLVGVRAKVDTGAYSSALDVAGYDLWEGAGGAPMVRFRLAPGRCRARRGTVFEAPVLRTVVVANSGGARQRRPLVEATVRLGPVTRRIHLTLSARPGLRCPMLLGRQALAGSFLVDVSRKYLLSRSSRPLS